MGIYNDQITKDQKAIAKAKAGRDHEKEPERENTWIGDFGVAWDKHFEQKKAKEAKQQEKASKAQRKDAQEKGKLSKLTNNGMESAALNAAMYFHPIGFAYKMLTRGAKKRMGTYEWKPLTSRPTGDPFIELAEKAAKDLPEGYELPPTMSLKDVSEAMNYAVDKADELAKKAAVQASADKCKDTLERGNGVDKEPSASMKTPAMQVKTKPDPSKVQAVGMRVEGNI